MTNRHFDRPDVAPERPSPDPAPWATAELGEDEAPTIVLDVVAGLLLPSFTRYLIVGGRHSHFH